MKIMEAYYDMKTPGSYGGIDALYRLVKQRGKRREELSGRLVGRAGDEQLPQARQKTFCSTKDLFTRN